ncbi:hypothetical protein [Mesobacillus selenatarsenatis]|uniref:hypothetical protein n=1 Tax=Mesobacillus selenatarsenatis TaxID=388741 RepID=UPI0005AB858C|nr:hypothetical protein [Mesobacillus selenatarsenatis]
MTFDDAISFDYGAIMSLHGAINEKSIKLAAQKSKKLIKKMRLTQKVELHRPKSSRNFNLR